MAPHAEQLHSKPQAGQLHWNKGRGSMNTGACVEVARVSSVEIAVRDSKNPDIEPFIYTLREMKAFLDGAKNNEFDYLVAVRSTLHCTRLPNLTKDVTAVFGEIVLSFLPALCRFSPYSGQARVEPH
jgi:hypothetical protein